MFTLSPILGQMAIAYDRCSEIWIPIILRNIVFRIAFLGVWRYDVQQLLTGRRVYYDSNSVRRNYTQCPNCQGYTPAGDVHMCEDFSDDPFSTRDHHSSQACMRSFLERRP